MGRAQHRRRGTEASQRFRVSRLLRPKLEELGLSPRALLRQAGLPPGLFEQDRILVSTAELFALYGAIEELSPDPGVGLRIGAEERVERYDPVAIAALHSSCFRDALARAGRYKQLTCPEEISVVDRGAESAVRFHFTLTTRPEPALLTDVCFAWVLAIARRGSGRPLTPLRVELERAASRREVHEAHFGCPVRFSAAHNALIFRRADLDRPFVTHNPELLAMIAPQLERELAERGPQASLRERVKATLKRLLAGQRPDLAAVARELGHSARTLQRRLGEAGLTYQTVLEDARRELAHHYLRRSSLALGEVAYLLGYEDSSSLFRAFQQWEGLSPGRWRSRQRGPGASAQA